VKKYLFPGSNLPELMLITLVVWLCSLAIIGLLVAPLFGAKVALTTAALLLVVLLALCWGICLYHTVKGGQRS
jgi:hypothetical protein